MAVPPELLDQIHVAHQAAIDAHTALDDLLNAINPNHVQLADFEGEEDIGDVEEYVHEVNEHAATLIADIDNILGQGGDLPVCLSNSMVDIHDRLDILNHNMPAAMNAYDQNNKQIVIGHLNLVLGAVQYIEGRWANIVHLLDPPQNDSNNGSNVSSNVSYGSNESNGGRRKKRTLRKRRSHSKKRTHRKRTNRKRTHSKRTHSKRTHRKRTHRK